MSNASAPASPLKGPPPPNPGVPAGHDHGKLFPLAIGALGIVYGDIGTSPLYALKECFAKVDGKVAPHAMEVGHDSVLGILSLVFWALTLVVTVKYLSFITRADNKGEGGMFALLALLPDRQRKSTAMAVMVGLFGAALLYGEGIITPGVSVLSAVEGLGVATHAMDTFIVPITLVILTGLFIVQKRGTGGIGRVFGPVMFVWFVVIAALGVRSIVSYPEVLEAANPYWAFRLFQSNPWHAFVVLGSVTLCITGGEALYADMGHFGAKPIRVSWFAMVFPALLLNYFGQGAFLLTHGWVENPFYEIVPRSMLYPMVALATAATVIASQALISGAFSLTRQAVQLGFMPRVTIVHTSAENAGQIYVPEVNYALMVACLALVVIFQKSSNLTAAYGIAVTGAMSITSVVFFFVATRNWKWPVWKALPLLVLFLSVDIPFFLANTLKFFDGGWVPTVIGISMFALMTTWKRGRAELAGRFNVSLMPLSALLEDLEATKPHRVRGTAVFMSGNSDGTPPVLLHHLKHNQVLHRQVVLLSIVPRDVPTVPKEEQIEVIEQGNGFWRVVWNSGFMETPNVPKILLRAREHELVCEPSTTSYFLGRETLLTSGKSPMMLWRKLLFAFVSRNALSATSYFGLPPGRVVELGMQVDL
ncbi:MAG: potassium transporter Kup [Archangium sp.]|nr:potassium transporter Kup [Archangium sp.]MDP3154090.1 potassium transporter Kup [Archangium sp.]MDP3570006.1 potassium transporter Kup [Archangium sp.]